MIQECFLFCIYASLVLMIPFCFFTSPPQEVINIQGFMLFIVIETSFISSCYESYQRILKHERMQRRKLPLDKKRKSGIIRKWTWR